MTAELMKYKEQDAERMNDAMNGVKISKAGSSTTR